MRDLTKSDVHRKNIFNNQFAITEIEKELKFNGVLFETSIRYTKKQISSFYDIDERTINRYLENHEVEFLGNGYEVLTGKRLREFKEAYDQYVTKNTDVKDIDVPNIADSSEDPEIGDISKAPKLGVFNFRTFLNIGMLLTDSDTAKQLRVIILDIVIDTLNVKIGGSTKFVNQRESEFFPSAVRELNYRQEFTNALDQCIVDNKWKYSQLTDAVYKSIFHENAKEYKQILKLKSSDSARDTMYSEVLDLIAAYENGYADYIKKKYKEIERKLTIPEANALFKEFQSVHSSAFQPLLEKSRTLMASRDMVFREALHEKLKNYVTHLNADEFDKFLGEKSMALEERLKENIDVFKRLKDR
jgi:hypothetical protein